jgi:two-component system nitrogen regulation response regulator GlnG
VSKLLVVDDEESICWGLSRLGESAGHEVVTASSAERALEALEDLRPDVIVLDVRLPGMDGLTAIEHFRRAVGEVPIIVVTAYGDLKTAVEAVRHGAFEYIVKPFDLEKVQRALTRALASTAATPRSDAGEVIAGLVGRSPAMQEVFKNIALAAASDSCVLVCGESGTGKELAARAIHTYGRRSAQPFVAVNVASLNSALTESELFGHVRGAFTGAETDRIGLIQQADGGTLFLDEVADIPLPIQVKLLRALEHGEVVPVGSNSTVKSHFRLVTATHQDLPQKVREGTFRHDLYYRLCAFQIEMPPLRERRQDIRPLAEHFIGLILGEGAASRPVLSRAADEELASRPWHGNVRELRNVLEHAVTVARRGVIDVEHLPPPISLALTKLGSGSNDLDGELSALVARWSEAQWTQSQEPEGLYGRLLRMIEPPLLQAAFEKHRGQCANAARCLGLHRTTLRKKLDEFGIRGE